MRFSDTGEGCRQAAGEGAGHPAAVPWLDRGGAHRPRLLPHHVAQAVQRIVVERLAGKRIGAVIDSGVITEWPTTCVDGKWVNFSSRTSGFGGFSDPFNNMNSALAQTTDGTKLHFQVGSSGYWSGTIDKKMLLDCPWGTVVIGE